MEYIKKLRGDFRLLICDNTNLDLQDTQKLKSLISNFSTDLFEMKIDGFDGFTHGASLDFLVSKTQTEIIGMMDFDFFWIYPDIISYVHELFKQGYEAVGCAGWYPDFQRVIDTNFPERAGHLAPVVWGQFLTRDLAISDTFICTKEESGLNNFETGWRIRKKIIEDKIPAKIFPGFKYPNQLDSEVCYFGSFDAPLGFHILKGTNRIFDYQLIRKMLDEGFEFWKEE